MNRWRIDLSTERNDEPFQIFKWRSAYIGSCDGEAYIRYNNHSSYLEAEEFTRLDGISQYNWIYIKNTAQAGKELVIYFEEMKPVLGGFLWI